MKIQYLIEHLLDDPNTYLYLERYVDAGSKTYSPFADQFEGELRYRPSSDLESFAVPCFKIPKEKVTIYLDNPNTQLLNHYIQKETVLFPVHPEILQDDLVAYIAELRTYPQVRSAVVSPTASTRTVMAINSVNHYSDHFIKLHYPRRISRFIRRLRRNAIEQSIGVSKDLINMDFDKFGYLPETIGISYGNDDAWGCIIREFIPRPIRKGKHCLIPIFTLYSQDMKNKDDLPLLVQLIEYLGEDPKTFTINHIMKPIIQMWCTALKERGILLEAHGQNTLLELNATFQPTRIIYRDLDLYIDPEIRKKHQLHTHFPKSHLIAPESRESIYSLKYDGFIGHHLFDYLTSLLKRFYNISPVTIQESCKETFHHFFPDANFYFSDKTFYYSNELLPNNKYTLVKTDCVPKWR